MKKGTVVYTEANKKEEAGVFTKKALAYAELDTERDNPAKDWLKIHFAAQVNGEETVAEGFIQAESMNALTAAETEQLEAKLGQDAQEYNGHKLQAVQFTFAVKEAEAEEPEQEEPVQEEEPAQPEEPTQEEPAAEAEPAPAAEPEQEEPVQDEPAQPAEEEPVHFEEGYAFVKRGKAVYASASTKTETGSFAEYAIVYAESEIKKDDPANDWLKVHFVTEKNGKQILESGYIQAKSAKALTAGEAEQLQAQLDSQALGYKGHKLSGVAFEYAATEEPEGSVKDNDLPTAKLTGYTKGGYMNASVKLSNASGEVAYQWYFYDGSSWQYQSQWYNQSTIKFSISEYSQYVGWELECDVWIDNIGFTAVTNYITIPGNLTAYPAGYNVNVGDTAYFYCYFDYLPADATVTYQWQYSTDGGSTWNNETLATSKKDTLKMAASVARIKRLYRCVAKVNGTKAYSKTVYMVAAIATPKIAVGDIGSAVKFKVTGLNLMGKVTYQWQYSKDKGSTWTDFTSASSKKAAFGITVTVARTKYLYRCVIHDDQGYHYSNPVKMKGTLTATASPARKAANVGKTAKFTVTTQFASGTVKYQWQYTADKGTTWKNVSTSWGSTTKTLSVPVTEGRLGFVYRCVVKDSKKTVKTNNVAVFGAKATPKAPTVATGATAKFTATAYYPTGTVKYQWQYSKDKGSTWTNAPSTWTGYKSKTLSLEMTAGRLKFYYRCKVTCSAGTVYTNKVHAIGKLSVTIKKSTSKASIGDTVKFNATTTNSSGDVTYTWQVSKDYGKTWETTSTLTAKATTSATLTIGNDSVNYYYRVKVKNGSQTATSNKIQGMDFVVKPTGSLSVKIFKGNVGAAVGDRVQLFATATNALGTVTYIWQVSKDNGSTWTECVTLNQLESSNVGVTLTSSNLNWYFRVKIRNGQNSATSGKIQLKDFVGTTTGDLSVSITRGTTSAKIGDSVKIVASTQGASGDVTYTWQYSKDDGSTWTTSSTVTGSNTSSASLTLGENILTYVYRVQVTNAGRTATSNTLRVMDFLLASTKPVYRALLIGERKFGAEGSSYYCARNGGDVVHMASMLNPGSTGVYGPGGTKYTVTSKYDLTKDQIKSAIQSTFSGTKDTDVSIFMIASHGVVEVSSGSGAGAIATMSSNLYFSELASWLNTYCKGQVIVIIETCGSGSGIYASGVAENAEALSNAEERITQEAVMAFARADHGFTIETTDVVENADGVVSVNTGELRVANKFYVLAAARHQEYSYGESETHYSSTQSQSGNVFINGLVKGVGTRSSSPADSSPKNKVVTLEETYKYIVSYVKTWSAKYPSDSWYDPSDPYTWGIDPAQAQHTQRYPKNSTYPLFMFR